MGGIGQAALSPGRFSHIGVGRKGPARLDRDSRRGPGWGPSPAKRFALIFLLFLVQTQIFLRWALADLQAWNPRRIDSDHGWSGSILGSGRRAASRLTHFPRVSFATISSRGRRATERISKSWDAEIPQQLSGQTGRL